MHPIVYWRITDCNSLSPESAPSATSVPLVSEGLRTRVSGVRKTILRQRSECRKPGPRTTLPGPVPVRMVWWACRTNRSRRDLQRSTRGLYPIPSTVFKRKFKQIQGISGKSGAIPQENPRARRPGARPAAPSGPPRRPAPAPETIYTGRRPAGDGAGESASSPVVSPCPRPPFRPGRPPPRRTGWTIRR